MFVGCCPFLGVWRGWWLRGCVFRVCLSVTCVCSQSDVMVNICVYNPMCINYLRLVSIAQELTNAAVIGLPGTTRRQDPYYGKCKRSIVQNFQHFEWGWLPAPGVNKSCGVSLLVRTDVFPPKTLNAIYSPPNHLTGRAGAVRYKSSTFDVLSMVLYVAPNTHPKYNKCNMQLFEWAILIRKKMPKRTQFFLLWMPTPI